MKFRTFVGGLAVLVGALTVAPTTTQATPISLFDLINTGGSITIDEGGGVFKVFDNFAATSVGSNPLALTAIQVSVAVSPPVGEVGLLFQITSGGLLFTGQDADLNLSFQVHCIGCLLHDDTLTMTASTILDGIVFIAETVVDLANLTQQLASQLVIASAGSNIAIDHKVFLYDAADILVTKDLNIQGGALTGSAAAVSDFGQTFSQTAVPGPATLLLLGVGLVGVGIIGRKRRNR